MEVDSEDVKSEITPIVNILGFASIEDFSKAGLASVVEASKYTNTFPSGPTRSLYAACPSFSKIVEFQSNKILDAISSVIKLNHVRGNIQRRDNDEKFELLLECNDIMLERINTNLDELAGIQKKPVTELLQTDLHSVSTPSSVAVSGSWNESKKADSATKAKTTRLLTARNIQRPQVSFKTPVDNSNKTPFEPRIKYKPNSIKPLAVLPEYDVDGNIEGYLHPYEVELNKFEVPPSQLEEKTPNKPKPLDDTPLVYVDTVKQLKQLTDELVGITELAVDLEHHSYRTFQGFTCLLQISTREKDYIIDTLSLRDELHVLNEVFTNPKVLKVFHGADSDVEWLQRDLSIYVVNMFDTHQAAKRLGLARLSLAFLIKHYCQLDLDKTFQLADWRIRPLPEELILYARLDTHYLLYVWDSMKMDLLKLANDRTNLLESVFQSSTNICKKRYIKPRIQSDSYLDFYRKSARIFDNRQLFALSAIFDWRDKTARQEDESYAYVLPNHMMLTIADALPREMQGILACCNPIPPLVRQNLQMLHQYILKAREQPLIKPAVEEQRAQRVPQNKDFNKDTNFLYCPHDMSFNKEFRDDLPTLLNGHDDNEELLTKVLISEKSSVSVFDTPENSDDDMAKEKLKKLKKIKFVSPYARYLAILPIAEQQRLEELKKQQEENKMKRLCPEKTEDMEEYVVIKEEPTDPEDVYSANMPLKDYGKRRRNEAIETVQEQTAKKIKSELPTNSSQTATSSILDASTADDAKSSPSRKKMKQNKMKQNKMKRRQQHSAQQSNHSAPFDYGDVDFKKFKGGSYQEKSRNNEVQTKFHGKNKHHGNNKKFNKLLTFGNVQSKAFKKK